MSMPTLPWFCLSFFFSISLFFIPFLPVYCSLRVHIALCSQGSATEKSLSLQGHSSRQSMLWTLELIRCALCQWKCSTLVQLRNYVVISFARMVFSDLRTGWRRIMGSMGNAKWTALPCNPCIKNLWTLIFLKWRHSWINIMDAAK